MSKTNQAPNAMTVLPAVPEALRRLAALAAQSVASLVTACAIRRTYRELAALDDRLLADIGLDRATVRDFLAQLPWHRTHTIT